MHSKQYTNVKVCNYEAECIEISDEFSNFAFISPSKFKNILKLEQLV